MNPTPPRVDMPDLAPSLQQEVARLSASPEVRSGFNWFRTQEPQLAHWQMEMARIAAPPFGESARGAWLAGSFRHGGPGGGRGAAVRRVGTRGVAGGTLSRSRAGRRSH